MGLFTRAIRPPDLMPNDNDPDDVPPATVGPPAYTPGDPHGVTVEDGPQYSPPPPVYPSPWSGWPADWNVAWSGQVNTLADTAWMCIDLNSSLLSTMPPYLVDAAPSLQADWLRNPDPEIYASWQEFAKAAFWDYQAAGETFILATARYSTGWPARFHVVPPWMVNVELRDGLRRYSIGSVDVTGDVLHVRYSSTVDNARGVGPLEAGQARLVAAQVLARYGATLAAGGGIPSGVLQHPEELSAEQAVTLQQQWVAARLSTIGEPAVLSGGLTWTPTQINPKDMALVELLQLNESRVAVLLRVPPFLVGLPSGADPMTYSNVTAIFDYHWRAGLRPSAAALMGAMSQWALPRGTQIELNMDFYVEPPPLERAQRDQILNSIVDSQGNPVKTVEQIQEEERLTNSTPTQPAGVLG